MELVVPENIRTGITVNIPKVTGKWTPIDDENTVSLAEGVYANLWAIYPYHADKENGLDYTGSDSHPSKVKTVFGCKGFVLWEGNRGNR